MTMLTSCFQKKVAEFKPWSMNVWRVALHTKNAPIMESRKALVTSTQSSCANPLNRRPRRVNNDDIMNATTDENPATVP